jgi:hypothetical protein
VVIARLKVVMSDMKAEGKLCRNTKGVFWYWRIREDLLCLLPILGLNEGQHRALYVNSVMQKGITIVFWVVDSIIEYIIGFLRANSLFSPNVPEYLYAYSI